MKTTRTRKVGIYRKTEASISADDPEFVDALKAMVGRDVTEVAATNLSRVELFAKQALARDGLPTDWSELCDLPTSKLTPVGEFARDVLAKVRVCRQYLESGNQTVPAQAWNDGLLLGTLFAQLGAQVAWAAEVERAERDREQRASARAKAVEARKKKGQQTRERIEKSGKVNVSQRHWNRIKKKTQ